MSIRNSKAELISIIAELKEQNAELSGDMQIINAVIKNNFMLQDKLENYNPIYEISHHHCKNLDSRMDISDMQKRIKEIEAITQHNQATKSDT